MSTKVDFEEDKGDEELSGVSSGRDVATAREGEHLTPAGGATGGEEFGAR